MSKQYKALSMIEQIELQEEVIGLRARLEQMEKHGQEPVAEFDRQPETSRRVAAVEKLLALGWKWDRGAWLMPPVPPVPDGLKLFPNELRVERDGVEAILYQAGIELEEHQFNDFCDVVLWVGPLAGDDSVKSTYGLNVGCAECMEEGSIPVVEFKEPEIAPTPSPTPSPVSTGAIDEMRE